MQKISAYNFKNTLPHPFASNLINFISFRTYYSNVDLTHKFHTEKNKNIKNQYYPTHNNDDIDDDVNDDDYDDDYEDEADEGINNNIRYYDRNGKSNHCYNPYDNVSERIRSPSLPPILRNKYR